jgi:dTDP-4-dehydrorhamnose reductase
MAASGSVSSIPRFEMRIAVIGKSGQIARALQARARGDISIHTLGRPAIDLTRPRCILPALHPRPDFVINAAAYTAVDRAENEPDLAFAVNAEGAGAVAAAAATLGVPILHLSTDYVFDGEKAGAYVEDDPVGPRSVYGRSKLQGERAVAAANPRYLILRTSWVYAPYGENFVATMLRLARSRSEVQVVNDQTGCPSFAPDIADALLSLALHLQSPDGGAVSGTYHLASPESTTWFDFAQRIFRVSAAHGGPSARVVPISTTAYGATAARPKNSVLDSGKFSRAFGLRLTGIDDALARCVPQLLTGMREAS